MFSMLYTLLRYQIIPNYFSFLNWAWMECLYVQLFVWTIWSYLTWLHWLLIPRCKYIYTLLLTTGPTDTALPHGIVTSLHQKLFASLLTKPSYLYTWLNYDNISQQNLYQQCQYWSFCNKFSVEILTAVDGASSVYLKITESISMFWTP